MYTHTNTCIMMAWNESGYNCAESCKSRWCSWCAFVWHVWKWENVCVCALKYKVSLLKSPRIIFVAPKAWCIWHMNYYAQTCSLNVFFSIFWLPLKYAYSRTNHMYVHLVSFTLASLRMMMAATRTTTTSKNTHIFLAFPKGMQVEILNTLFYWSYPARICAFSSRTPWVTNHSHHMAVSKKHYTMKQIIRKPKRIPLTSLKNGEWGRALLPAKNSSISFNLSSSWLWPRILYFFPDNPRNFRREMWKMLMISNISPLSVPCREETNAKTSMEEARKNKCNTFVMEDVVSLLCSIWCWWTKENYFYEPTSTITEHT